MALTNRLNLPHSIVEAVKNDKYVGGGDISVTKLIAPPYQRNLLKTHSPVEDVADRIWALIGQIGHSILERYPSLTGLIEERLYMPVTGPTGEWNVSGQFDLLENRILSDFKFTSVWAGKDGGKIEWEQQMNLLRLLCNWQVFAHNEPKYGVDQLQIVAIYRDWQKSKVGTEGYPTSQVEVIPIELWMQDRAMAFMVERVRLHQDPNPEPCTDEERWKRSDVYAAMKTGGKRAIKLFSARPDADTWLAEQKDKDSMWIETRAGEYVRCASYCSVSHVCPVWQARIAEATF